MNPCIHLFRISGVLKFVYNIVNSFRSTRSMRSARISLRSPFGTEWWVNSRRSASFFFKYINIENNFNYDNSIFKIKIKKYHNTLSAFQNYIDL